MNAHKTNPWVLPLLCMSLFSLPVLAFADQCEILTSSETDPKPGLLAPVSNRLTSFGKFWRNLFTSESSSSSKTDKPPSLSANWVVGEIGNGPDKKAYSMTKFGRNWNGASIPAGVDTMDEWRMIVRTSPQGGSTEPTKTSGLTALDSHPKPSDAKSFQWFHQKGQTPNTWNLTLQVRDPANSTDGETHHEVSYFLRGDGCNSFVPLEVQDGSMSEGALKETKTAELNPNAKEQLVVYRILEVVADYEKSDSKTAAVSDKMTKDNLSTNPAGSNGPLGSTVDGAI